MKSLLAAAFALAFGTLVHSADTLRYVALVNGGKDKAGEFERLAPLVRAKAKAVLTIGSAAPKVEAQLAGAAPIVPCGDLRGAIDYGRANAKPGDVVLLSPAFASFDQFNNFEHRGEVFEQMVRAILS